MYICLNLSFALQKRCYTDSISLCPFWLKENDFVNFGTQIFELWVDSEIKVYRDTFIKDISFWIYVKIRYENFHCSVIVDKMQENCVLLEKLRNLQRVAHVFYALCALGFKKGRKSTEAWTVHNTALNSSMGIDITTYRIRIGRFGPGSGYISTGIAETHSSFITGSDIHYRMLATMVLLTFLLKCCVMT